MQAGGRAARDWWGDRKGSIAVHFAILLPMVLTIVGGALDYGQALVQRDRLQAMIDKAALAAARELGLSDARRENVPEVVAAMVRTAIAASGGDQALPRLDTKVVDDPLEVHVIARHETRPLFGALGLGTMQLELQAVARILGQPNICLLGLDPSKAGTIDLRHNARVTGQNCAVFSNSGSVQSISSKSSAVLTASLICSAGGKDGGKGNFAPEPLTDCPMFDDPLADRPEPFAGPCDPQTPKRIVSSMTLPPGTYCGGLEVAGGARVELMPGVHVIRDGALVVRDGGGLIGDGAGIFLAGDKALLRFDRYSHIDLVAPRTGPMAGLLIFASRSQKESSTHEILSDDARNLLGTLYFPTTRFHVDATNPIADRSAYTAIVARMVTLDGGPHLVLNANYELTNVPVPRGIRGASQPVALVK